MNNWINISGKKFEKGNIIDEIITCLLENRGIKNEDRKHFFDNNLNQISWNESLINKNDFQCAVDIIKQIVEERKKILIYGDYDTDGVCSTAIIWQSLYAIGANAMPFIPNRKDDGYGLSEKSLDKVLQKYNPDLLITVDNGISALKPVRTLKDKGIKVIIIDHHICGDQAPDADCIIHSVSYCASGISYFFADYLSKHIKNKSNKNHYEDLAALGTVADMIPLTGVNRDLVKTGLKCIRSGKRLGLKKLIEKSGLTSDEVESSDLGFLISPRINAAGRLDDATDALRLLCTRNEANAEVLTDKLCRLNRERQNLTVQSYSHARNYVLKYISQNNDKKIMVVSDSSYEEGIIGLVAGKLSDEFNLPSVVISQKENISRASVRSIKGIDILRIIKKTSFLLEGYGGHEQAAGLSVKTENINRFRIEIENIVNNDYPDKFPHKSFHADLQLDLNQINENLYSVISEFKPYGNSNALPLFISENIKVHSLKKVGVEGKHLSLTVSGNGSGKEFQCIGFNLGNRIDNISQNSNISILYSIIMDRYNGTNKLKLSLKDVKISG